MPIAKYKARSVEELQSYDDACSDGNLFVKEFTHRINNDLTSTIGFASLTAARSGSDEVKVALAGVIQQILEIARIYRALQMPASDHWVNASDYLRELSQAISCAKLQYKDIELVFVEAPLQLTALSCWRLGLIIAELITNASRHAFCGVPGQIRVELCIRGNSAECSVIDNGSALENSQPRQGMRIIRSLTRDLNGRIDHYFGAQGTIATLSFPLIETEQPSTNVEAQHLKPQ